MSAAFRRCDRKPCSEIIRVVQIFGIDGLLRDYMFLAGPFAEIDQFATFAAEGAEWRFWTPIDRFAALRAFNLKRALVRG